MPSATVLYMYVYIFMNLYQLRQSATLALAAIYNICTYINSDKIGKEWKLNFNKEFRKTFREGIAKAINQHQALAQRMYV